MRHRITPQSVILALTGILFISGLFFAGYQTRQRIQSFSSDLSSFSTQIQEQQELINNAHTSFADAIQSEKDLLNWRARKAAGVSSASQDYGSEKNSSESYKDSVFSENTSPEYNTFTGNSSDNDMASGQSSDTGSDSIFSDHPAA